MTVRWHRTTIANNDTKCEIWGSHSSKYKIKIFYSVRLHTLVDGTHVLQEPVAFLFLHPKNGNSRFP
jgi:hypothetical protein